MTLSDYMISLTAFLWALGLCAAAFGALLKIIWDVLTSRIKTLEDNMAKLSNDIHEIRYNYLNRFDDMKTHISSVKEEIIERINKIA